MLRNPGNLLLWLLNRHCERPQRVWKFGMQEAECPGLSSFWQFTELGASTSRQVVCQKSCHVSKLNSLHTRFLHWQISSPVWNDVCTWSWRHLSPAGSAWQNEVIEHEMAVSLDMPFPGVIGLVLHMVYCLSLWQLDL